MSDGFLGREIGFEWGGLEIEGIRQKAIACNGAPIDVTSDENDGWRTLLEIDGQMQIDLTLTGITKSNRLKYDWFQGTRIKTATFTYPDGHTISGSFRLANYTDTGPYKDATTFQATLQSTGVVTITPYT